MNEILKKARMRIPRLLVSVEQKHIDEAIRKHSGQCMISEAIKEQFPQYSWVSTDVQTIRFSDLEKRLRYAYLTPQRPQVAIVQFDQGLPMQPFTFKLHSAHVTSLYKRKSSVKQKQAVSLGPKHIQSHGKKRILPDIIGGKLAPRHPSGYGMRREYGGLRLTMKDIIPEAKD